MTLGPGALARWARALGAGLSVLYLICTVLGDRKGAR